MPTPVQRIERILRTQEPVIRLAYSRMIRSIESTHTLGALADLIEAGRWESALDTALRATPNLGDAVNDSFLVAARSAARRVGRELGVVSLAFDQTNLRAVNAMRDNSLRLVRGFTQQQREATRQALIRGIEDGVNPRDMARRFRRSIGLTARQERSVGNFARALQDLDKGALRRALRDRRFDRTILRAIETGEPLSATQVETMVGRYRARFVAHRAEVIARTEALRSVHQGTQAMFQQALAEGDVEPGQLVREWNTAKDERVRDSHADMHGQVRGIDEPFTSGRGNSLMWPGDPSAPAEDTVQCRCAVGTRIREAVPSA